MRNFRQALFCGFLLALLSVGHKSARASALVDPLLSKQFRPGSTRPIRVIILLDLPKGPELAPRRYDRPRMLAYLRQRAARAERELRAQISRQGVRGVRIIKLFASSLSVSADVTAEGLEGLRQISLVAKIYANHRMTAENGFNERRQPPRRAYETEDESPYNFHTSGLVSLRNQHPQFTGAGVVVGHIDTGVDASHPALVGKIIAFYDGKQGQRTDRPLDTHYHGTHTAGTIVGGSPSDTKPIGVAPGAKLVSAAALGSWEEQLKGMEFMLDPDGNPSTQDQPRLVNSSWNSSSAPDQEPFYRAISAWEAAGILPVFSAGNLGPAPKTITTPHEHPEAFAIANAGPNFVISSHSSRGPGIFKGQEIEKPDLTAPGTDIYSAVPGGKFDTLSGTSMAAPHVSGAVALMLQANSALTPAQLRLLLVRSSVPLSESGVRMNAHKWNSVYGWGHIDIAAAVKAALDFNSEGGLFGGSRGNGFLTRPRDVIERDSSRLGLATRSLDDSWALVREHASRSKAWLSPGSGR